MERRTWCLTRWNCWSAWRRSRHGLGAIRARVAALLQAGTAHWCPLVRLELWNGAGGDREKKVLREFERLVPELAITSAVWDDAHHHGARLEHADSDFDRIATAANHET
jgi:hypothetical protein